MAPRKDGHFVALIEEKDTKIAELQISLETHIAHAMATKSRLITALDALDSLRTHYTSELAAQGEANKSLREKLARYSSRARVAEAERDQLRDVVVDLSNKIEFSNLDFTSWSHNRLKIPRLLEPLHDHPTSTGLSGAESAPNLWAYASWMIRFLRDTLTTERGAHAATRRAARARIAILEAQLARRDVELEYCVMHGGQTFPRAHNGPHYPNISLPPSPPPVSVSDMKETVRRTSEENLVLEEEVRQLELLLEEAGLSHHDDIAPELEVLVSIPAAQPSTLNMNHSTTPTRASPAEPAPPLPEPRRRKRDRPRIPSPSRAPEAFDPDRTIRPATHSSNDGGTRTVPGDMHASLDRDIAELGAKIDRFHLEKMLLRAQVRELESGSSQNHSPRSQEPAPLAGPTAITTPPRNALLHPPAVDDFDGEMSMDLATPLVPTLMLRHAGPSTLQPSAPPSVASRSPPPPVSTEISPLDLSSDLPLPSLYPSLDITDTSLHVGEQAVQELMNSLSAARPIS
ncbi:hypothetical protein B0H16DRAFT_156136 [Mycena metata]|uniref:Uncharacterized protein n=1 Tax=Mycena metata TaxID=1033252 RepID=A0AAD7MWR6_9AGAR|nr:hypothetical protein B0H16DRAFT_156136 [Mycena metata]